MVQLIQDANNSLPWIAGKPAIVRVFFKIADPQQPPLAGVVSVPRGFRDGAELRGWLAAHSVVSRSATKRSLSRAWARLRIPSNWTF